MKAQFFSFKTKAPVRIMVRCLAAAVMVILAIKVISAWSQVPRPFEKSGEVQSVVDANTAFAVDLYQKLKDQRGNLFFSPYSISSALAMTYAGARGQTEGEMAKVLHFDSTQTDVHAAFGQLTRRLNSVQRWNRIKLLDANSLWCQADYPFDHAFLKLTQKDYEATAQPVDFIRAPEAARNDINSWVAQKTDGKIQEIEPGAFSPDTRLVLCNAIYFKGKWQAQFDSRKTEPGPFYVTTNQTVMAPMMSLHAKFAMAYDESNAVEMLEMPYVGNDLSMVILLPSTGPEWSVAEQQQPGLSGLEEKLTAENLRSWLNRLDGIQPGEIDISIPRFKTSQSFDLWDPLKSMGMSLAFDGNQADFSGMDGTTNLYISDVVHKAYVEVNEEGTEAAAATGVTMMTASLTERFVVDHPFIFLIKDNGSGSILFLGRVVDPTK